MDAITSYTYGSAAWFAIQAVPLLLFPNLITAMLSPEARRPTDLETYLSRSLSLSLFTLALVTLVLTGSLPLTSSLAEPPTPPHTLALPTLVLTTAFHASAAFYAWTQYTRHAQTAFALGVAGSGALAAMGVWCLLFGGENGARGRTHVSGFPFGNEEVRRRRAEKEREREGRKEVGGEVRKRGRGFWGKGRERDGGIELDELRGRE